MNTPLAISKLDIAQATNHLFPVTVEEVEFIPIGESSWLYIATQQHKMHTLVIKIQKRIDVTASGILNYLVKQDFPWMPRIIMSKNGNMWEKYENFYYSVQHYIEPGILHQANSHPDATYLRELGHALHDLHAISVDTRMLKDVPRDTFRSDMAHKARVVLDELHTALPTSPSIARLQKELKGLLPVINRIFANVEQYGNQLAAQNHTFVICHGDVHFGNILKLASDRLYIIDWDEAMVALPEFDLTYMSDEQLAYISQGYGRTLPLNPLALCYYRNYLLVRALWFWISKLLSSKQDEQPSVTDTILKIFAIDSPYLSRAIE